MLSGFNSVLEIGCADAFGTRIVQQFVKKIKAVDFDPIFIEDIKKRNNSSWHLNCFEHDIIKEPVQGKFDAIFSLDVLEHINPKDEKLF